MPTHGFIHRPVGNPTAIIHKADRASHAVFHSDLWILGMNLWISMWTGAAQPESANAGLPPNPREVVQSVMQAALRGSFPACRFRTERTLSR